MEIANLDCTPKIEKLTHTIHVLTNSIICTFKNLK